MRDGGTVHGLWVVDGGLVDGFDDVGGRDDVLQEGAALGGDLGLGDEHALLEVGWVEVGFEGGGCWLRLELLELGWG